MPDSSFFKWIELSEEALLNNVEVLRKHTNSKNFFWYSRQMHTDMGQKRLLRLQII